MVIGLFIFIIGLIPIVLALGTLRLFNNSKIAVAVLLYMILISIWQFSVCVLYFPGTLSKETALLLFRMFRMGPTYAMSAIFYVVLIIVESYQVLPTKKNLFSTLISRLITKKFFYVYVAWSTFVFVMNWSKFGIKNLTVLTNHDWNLHYYFPSYGSFNIVYFIHVSSLIPFLLSFMMVAIQIQNKSIKRFLTCYAMYSLLLFIFGFLNFIPETGAIFSSLGIVIFSILLIFEFIKMNIDKTTQYNELLKRQKKLDYAGSLSGSLIHEVKNNVQVIKGVTKLIKENMDIDPKNKELLQLMDKASHQLEGIADNYSLYIKQGELEFTMQDIKLVLEEVCEMVGELTKKQQVSIQVNTKEKGIKAYINKPNLQQVFLNLIKNSIESIPPERSSRIISIQIKKKNEHVIISFRDSGKGIESTNLNEIFNPFMTTKPFGMGMGLAFVQKIIFEHRGDILIKESSINGTHFEISIPQYPLSE
ncbi:ATP-binding protein [Niallia sp. 03133]|uniref:ATP-binding protein n=1 Tax=Niallia sp. 03133 TaxID=3458060 RepID=UPI0040449A7C